MHLASHEEKVQTNCCFSFRFDFDRQTIPIPSSHKTDFSSTKRTKAGQIETVILSWNWIELHCQIQCILFHSINWNQFTPCNRLCLTAICLALTANAGCLSDNWELLAAQIFALIKTGYLSSAEKSLVLSSGICQALAIGSALSFCHLNSPLFQYYWFR